MWEAQHSTLYTLHFILHNLHFRLLTPHFTHSTLPTPHFTLHTPYFILHILHFILHFPHTTLFHSTLQTGITRNMYKNVQINCCREVFCVTAYPCRQTTVLLTFVWAFKFVGCILFFRAWRLFCADSIEQYHQMSLCLLWCIVIYCYVLQCIFVSSIGISSTEEELSPYGHKGSQSRKNFTSVMCGYSELKILQRTYNSHRWSLRSHGSLCPRQELWDQTCPSNWNRRLAIGNSSWQSTSWSVAIRLKVK